MKKTNQTHWVNAESFPEYLRSYELLEQHFRAQLKGLSNTEKGDKFARFVQRLVPQTETGSDFQLPDLCEKKSSDEGVDLIAKGKDGCSVLYIQAKLWVDRADDIDSVLSKFQAYRTKHHSSLGGQQQSLFALDQQPTHFMLVTLSPLEGIINKYTKTEFSSKSFYQDLISENRLHFVDGHQILPILRAAYGKISQLPTDLVLNLDAEVIQKGNVFIGIISSGELKRLYKEFGDALFFENVRDFLGLASREVVGRTSPNKEIMKTVNNCPEKMLERNNGIVFRADEVSIEKSRNQLKLNKGSIVNGCQTTMCLVTSATESSCVLVKIVQTNDSWDIAKAANYQNYVYDIDLELARNMRPQLAKRAATVSGIQLEDGEESAFQIIEAIYDRKLAYDETRLIYIGLFSRTPNNVFASNYTELMQELIDKFYQDDPYWEKVFETLFELQAASQEGIEAAHAIFKNPTYAGMFNRLYKKDSPAYRCFISILALCGAVNMNIAERLGDPTAEHIRVKEFFSQARTLLRTRKARFLRCYRHAVKIWMQEAMPAEGEDAEIRRDMHTRSKQSGFTILFRKLLMEADADDWLCEEEKQFQQQNT